MTILMHVLQAEPFDRQLANRLVNQYKADVNHVDKHGQNLLIKLVLAKEEHLIDFLLAKKEALMHVTDSKGRDACDYAKENGLALKMREFLNCSKRKKDADNRELN